MTYEDFGAKFCSVVGELWNRWALREWNESNQAIVWEIVRYWDVSAVCDCLRQQRFADPDAIKPNWKQLRADLKAKRGESSGRTANDIEAERQAKIDTQRFNDWMRGRSKANLQMLMAAMLADCPRLRFAIGFLRVLTDDRFACRILMLWEKNSLDRFFEKYRGPAPEVVRQPSLLDQLDNKPADYRGNRALPPPVTKHEVVSAFIHHEAQRLEAEPTEPISTPHEDGPLEPAGAIPDEDQLVEFPADDIPF